MLDGHIIQLQCARNYEQFYVITPQSESFGFQPDIMGLGQSVEDSSDVEGEDKAQADAATRRAERARVITMILGELPPDEQRLLQDDDEA